MKTPLAKPLDKYEQELEKFLSVGKFKSTPNLAKTKKFFEQAVKNHDELQKSKPVTLRLNQKDLLKIKAKAKQHHIPYQRLISALVHQFAEEKRKIVI
ncbi:MAG: hypothetical protein HYS86_01695 [Candidatus Chisholmbacteria bacterium]|nr:hypothetical protein [Candidatus Chisholmbacteria bacterium]